MQNTRWLFLIIVFTALGGCSSGELKKVDHQNPAGMDSQIAKKIQELENHIKTKPTDVNSLAQLGYLYGSQGSLDKEVEYYKKTLEIYPEFKAVHYNLACALALKKEKGQALRHLELALRYGFQHREAIENDRDLNYLRSDPDFIALLKKYFN